MYHKFGHPWSRIFNAQFEDPNKDQDIDIDETSFMDCSMEDKNPVRTSEHHEKQESEFTNALQIKNCAEETSRLVQIDREEILTKNVNVIIENQRENLELEQ